MPELPTGTVTVPFTDLEGSTRGMPGSSARLETAGRPVRARGGSGRPSATKASCRGLRTSVG